jgi:hypothetical protein
MPHIFTDNILAAAGKIRSRQHAFVCRRRPWAFDVALFFADHARDRIYVMYKGVYGLPDPTNRQIFVGPAINPFDLVMGVSASRSAARCGRPKGRFDVRA